MNLRHGYAAKKQNANAKAETLFVFLHPSSSSSSSPLVLRLCRNIDHRTKYLLRSMRSSCVLEVQVNGEQTFFLSKEVLLHRCGRLLKEYRKALRAEREGEEGGISLVRMFLHELPGGARAFEMVARFCYRGGMVKMNMGNVALLRCVADYLEMSEEYGAGNLLQKTEFFLSTMAMWSWKDTITVLTSCETLLPFAEKARIIQRCVDSLAIKANPHYCCISPNPSSTNSPNPGSISPNPNRKLSNPTHKSPNPNRNSSYCNRNTAHSSCKSPNPNRSPALPTCNSPNPSLPWKHSSCNAPHRNCNLPHPNCNSMLNWWCEDMSPLSMYMMERLVKAMVAYCVDNKHIAKVLLRYLEASLPLLGYSSLSVGTGKFSTDEHILQEYAQRVQREVMETVVGLLHSLEWTSVPVKSLFELRRVSMAMNATNSCKRQLEEMIGSQLHKASLDNILIPRFNGRERRTCLYDVDLILRLVKLFLCPEAVDKLQARSGCNGDLRPSSPGHDSDSELCYGYSGELGSSSPAPLKMVGSLMDMYLAEIAPDVHLKATKFSELAEALPCKARDTHDGLYRAVDIYLQAHPRTTVEDAVQVYRVIDFEKLSFEACKHVMENPRIPARFSFQVLASQQDKLRTVLESSMQCSRRTSAEDGNAYPPAATRYASLIRQNEELRSDLQSMQAKVVELERLCKGLRSQMSQEVRLSC